MYCNGCVECKKARRCLSGLAGALSRALDLGVTIELLDYRSHQFLRSSGASMISPASRFFRGNELLSTAQHSLAFCRHRRYCKSAKYVEMKGRINRFNVIPPSNRIKDLRIRNHRRFEVYVVLEFTLPC